MLIIIIGFLYKIQIHAICREMKWPHISAYILISQLSVSWWVFHIRMHSALTMVNPMRVIYSLGARSLMTNIMPKNSLPRFAIWIYNEPLQMKRLPSMHIVIFGTTRASCYGRKWCNNFQPPFSLSIEWTRFPIILQLSTPKQNDMQLWN